MMNLNQVDWTDISYLELDMMLRLSDQVNLELNNHLTPLCMACRCNREDLVTVLLHHGAQTNKPCSFYHKQPLHFACDHSAGNLGVVRKLLQAEANVDATDLDGNTGLHLACTESNKRVVELLIESGADVNSADVDGETPLVRACFAQSMELIDLLLKMGSDPNICCGHPVRLAILNSSVESLQLLLGAGASIEEGGYMNLACELSNVEMMKILKSHGIDINKRERLGLTPLHAACLTKRASEDCVRHLLEWGAAPNTTTCTGFTALYFSIVNYNVEKVRLLLGYGGIVIPSQSLTSMLSCLTSAGNLETCLQIFSLLLADGTKFNSEDLACLKDTVGIMHNAPGKADLIDLIATHASKPLSLQALCRIRIRVCVKSNIDINMKTLPLPSHVISFLNFCDIAQEPVYN